VHNFFILLKQRILVLGECLVNGGEQVLNKVVREGVQLILFVVLIYILSVILLHLFLLVLLFVIINLSTSVHFLPTLYIQSPVNFIK
jgi:hypothetical protein